MADLFDVRFSIDFRHNEMSAWREISGEWYEWLLNASNEREMHIREIIEGCPRVHTDIVPHMLYVIGMKCDGRGRVRVYFYDSVNSCIYPMFGISCISDADASMLCDKVEKMLSSVNKS